MTDIKVLIPTDPITGANYFVLRDHTLVYSTNTDGFFNVMQSDSLKGHDWKNGRVCANSQDLQPATVADFKRFGISLEGFL